jgi:hypothetical protein
MLDSSWTIGVPPSSGLWETLLIYGDGTFKPEIDSSLDKAIRVANWTVTPQGAWHRVEYDYDWQAQEYVTRNLNAASQPRRDNFTSGIYSLDSEFTAYRPVQK